VTYLIEYLGEFEFIFENVLGYVSGGQMDCLEAKKKKSKSHAWAPLRGGGAGPSEGDLHPLHTHSRPSGCSRVKGPDNFTDPWPVQ
jgi:hypothetical protein